MNNKTVAFHNLGCKVNAYETDAMQEQLEAAGYTVVPFQDSADVYVINTCTVTNMADRKSRQMLHRAKKRNPDSVIVAAGCYVQAQVDAGNSLEYVDVIIGNNEKSHLAEILEKQWEKGKEPGTPITEVIDINHTNEYEELAINHTAEHTRAYMKVQDGCNQFCSYCIIPFARGRVRSRKPDQVLEEARQLARAGYKEVVLTGIHLSSYGIDFTGEQKGEDLLSLIQLVHDVDGIQRIRLGSLEPRIVTETFAKTLSQLPKICPHFHLSLQSGCNDTLRRMNRRYTAEEYKEKCELLRTWFAHPALTTDVIVGFPGETEEEFEESRKFVSDIHFYETHIFKYSQRQGTKAAEMENQVRDEVKNKRSNVMLEINRRHQADYEASLIGRDVEVLIERQTERNGVICQEGHTKEYVRVAIPGEENLENHTICTKICNISQILH